MRVTRSTNILTLHFFRSVVVVGGETGTTIIYWVLHGITVTF